MDFHQLLAKMQELDQSQASSTPMVEQPVTECPPEGPMGMPGDSMGKPDVSPPSMSVNLNAQGLDNIGDILKLIAKVNPDTEKPMDSGLPSLSTMPSIVPPGPKIGGLGNLDSGPLKMLPDLDSDEPGEEPGGEPKTIDFKFGDEPGDEGGEEEGGEEEDGEEGDEGEDEKEAFGNSLNGSEPETKGIDAAIPNGNDLNKPKKSFSDKPYRGDNPMAAESTDLRAQIRAELQRRLNEAKGVK